MLTDPDKQATGNREPAYEKFSDEMNTEDPTQGIPDWLQPYTDNLEDLEMHVLEMEAQYSQCCLVSRHGVSVGQILPITQKAWGVRDSLKCGPGKKEV